MHKALPLDIHPKYMSPCDASTERMSSFLLVAPIPMRPEAVASVAVLSIIIPKTMVSKMVCMNWNIADLAFPLTHIISASSPQ